MTPTVATICWAVFLIVFIQTALCVLYLNRTKVAALIERARVFLVKCSGEEKRLQLEIEKQQATLLSMKGLLTRELQKERGLAKLSKNHSVKAEKLERRARKPGKQNSQRKAAVEVQRSKNLLALYEEQQHLISKLRADIELAESSLPLLHLRKVKLHTGFNGGPSSVAGIENLLSGAEYSAKRARATYGLLEHRLRAHEAEVKYSLQQSREKALDAFESIVAEREREAGDNLQNLQSKREALYKIDFAERVAWHKKSLIAAQKMAEADRKLLDHVTANIERGSKLFHSAVDAVRTLSIAIDPSVERSYQRLCKQLFIAHQWAERSVKVEIDLEIQMKYFESSEQHAEAAALLERLRTHRKRNVIISQRMYAASCICQRLYALKLLLCALPASTTSDFGKYAGVVRAVCGYLRDAWRQDGVDEQSPDESAFEQAIAELESRAQMAYIQLAKADAKSLSAAALTNLQQNVLAVCAALEAELSEQQQAFEKWNAMVVQASQDNRELLVAAASDRKEQCAIVVASVERSLQVLSVIAAALKEKCTTTETKTPPE